MTAQSNVVGNVVPFRMPQESDVARHEATPIKADLDNGYTRVANALLEAMCHVELTSRQFRVFLAVVRKTYGYQKKADWITAEQLRELAEYKGSSTHICADLRELKARKLIIQDGRKMGPNPVFSEWVFTKPKRKVTATGHQGTDRKAFQKEPELVTNVTENGHLECHDERFEGDQNRSLEEPKPVTQVTESGHKRCPKSVTTKEKKETYPKEMIEKARTKRATQAPTDFDITDELFAWAIKNQITTDLVIETDKFLDYHRAKDSTFKCWNSAWRNWMRNSMRFAPKPTRHSHLNEYGAAGNSTVPGDVYGFHDTSWADDLGI